MDSTKGVKKIKANSDLIKTLQAEDNISNAIIAKKASEIRQLSKRLLLEGTPPTIYHVKQAYARIEQGKEALKGDFFELFDEYLEESKQRLKHGTIKQFKVLKNHLLKFQTWNKRKIVLEAVDRALVTKFMGYLIEQKGFINDTANSNLKRLKTLLKHLYDEGYLMDRSFERVKPLPTATDSQRDIVYVTANEFEKIRKYDLMDNPRLDRVRDVFVFGSATGLRYGDLIRVGPEHIVNGFIEITTEKTTQRLSIPLNSIALSILEKYDNQIPYISNQKFNKYIKELAKLVKLKSKINKVYFKGNQPSEVSFEKHELISSHSMRKTFITLGKKYGMSTETIMKIVGHSSYDMTKKYQDIDRASLEEEMSVWDEPMMKVAK